MAAQNPPHGAEGHVCTAQETTLYDAMTAGDWDTVDEVVWDAIHGDQTPPSTPPPPGWRPPAQVIREDYNNAWNHYQDDHEAPEEEREAATREQVAEENDELELMS